MGSLSNRLLLGVLIALCFVSFSPDAFGQSTNRMFRRLHMYHPDCPTNVTALLQDQRGFIWMGSRDGLYRFDGHDFKVFRNDPADRNSLQNNHITSLFQDGPGNIWIGMIGGLQMLDPAKLVFHQPPLDAEFLEKIKSGTVVQVHEDRHGYLWIVTNQLGTLRYHPPTNESVIYDNYKAEAGVAKTDASQGIVEDRTGNLWLSRGDGIYRYQPDIRQFVEVPFEVPEVDDRGNRLNNIPMGLVATKDGSLWVSTFDGGLYRRNPNTGTWTGFQHDPDDPESLGDNRVLRLYQDSKDNLWVGTVQGGLNRFDPQRQSFVRYQNTVGEINSISANHVFSVLEDRNGLIWAGTIKGVDVLKPVNAQFDFFQRDGNARSTLSSDKVSALLEDSRGQVWVGTRDAGLNRYDPQTRTYRVYRFNASDPNGLGNDTVWSILEDRQGRLWVTTSKGILHLYEPTTESFRRFMLPDIGTLTFQHQIRCITEDENGILWMGTLGSGLYAFDPQTETFQVFLPENGNDRSLSSNAIFTLQADQQGGLWLGTLGGGVCYLDLEEQLFTCYPKASGESSHNWTNKNIYALFVDRRQRVWVGTGDARLAVYDPDKDAFKYFPKKNQEASHIIAGITDDAQGNLWLATDGGLLHMTPPEDLYSPQSVGRIKHFTREDGLQDNDFFKTTAVHQSPSGHIYVGGHQGFNRFHPDSLVVRGVAPEVMLTDFQIFNRSVPLASGRDLSAEQFYLDQHIEYLDKIALNHQQRSFSVHFAATDYGKTRQALFAYRLSGFNPEWTEIGRQHSLTFTNLDAGNYTLEIRAAGSKGSWSEKVRSLHLVISPPWWQRTWAYLLWTTLIVAVLYGLYTYNLRRQLEKAETRRMKELDHLKSRLYTNITHEFRTPLTVILGMADQISENAAELPKSYKEKISSGLDLIHRNGKNLLRLINQLLDLSKLDSGKLKLQPVQGDIVAYLQYLTESFYSMAEDKGVRLVFYSEEKSLLMDYDEEKIRQIVYNLLSNAIKFTPEKGKVVFHICKEKHPKAERLQMRINDTGVGIAAADLAHVFDRFYQADDSTTRKGEGTGIGLALTKELMELMQGEIRVESTPDSGTTFSIYLPISQEAPLVTSRLSGQISPSSSSISKDGVFDTLLQSENTLEKPDAPILLIIEDNADVVRYIQNLLKDDYLIHTAENGRIGIDRAFQLVPDIIISDVMMPEKDGFEVCRTLKQDQRTSHIPIILLTARAGQEDRVEGLLYGADAYLTKPFQKRELLIRLQKLVELRRQLQTRLVGRQLPTSTPDSESIFLEGAERKCTRAFERYGFRCVPISRQLRDESNANVPQTKGANQSNALPVYPPDSFAKRQGATPKHRNERLRGRL